MNKIVKVYHFLKCCCDKSTVTMIHIRRWINRNIKKKQNKINYHQNITELHTNCMGEGLNQSHAFLWLRFVIRHREIGHKNEVSMSEIQDNWHFCFCQCYQIKKWNCLKKTLPKLLLNKTDKNFIMIFFFHENVM